MLSFVLLKGRSGIPYDLPSTHPLSDPIPPLQYPSRLSKNLLMRKRSMVADLNVCYEYEYEYDSDSDYIILVIIIFIVIIIIFIVIVIIMIIIST